MFRLPPELQAHIWSFDSTIKEIFQKSLDLVSGVRYVSYICTSCYAELDYCKHTHQKIHRMNYSEYVDRITKFFPTFHGHNQRSYNKTYIHFCRRQGATHTENIFRSRVLRFSPYGKKNEKNAKLLYTKLK